MTNAGKAAGQSALRSRSMAVVAWRQQLPVLLLLFALGLSAGPAAARTTPQASVHRGAIGGRRLSEVADPAIEAPPIVTPSARKLAKFVDALPRPPTVDATRGGKIHLSAYVIKQKLHRDLPPTELYAYGTSQAAATYPAPTIETRRGAPLTIEWGNKIHQAIHMLPVDPTIHRARDAGGGVPTVPHMHGAEVPSEYDGHPDAWFTANNGTGAAYVDTMYKYPNSQGVAHLWYHDHTVGITTLNVISGLVGNYFLRDPSGQEAKLQSLPHGEYEMPLLIQDKAFFANGSIAFPNHGVTNTHPVWVPEFYGDTILVNGKAWPYMNVKRTAYRFRVLNAAAARFLQLSFQCVTAADVASDFDPPPNGTVHPFYQIGSDGGYLHKPVKLHTILMAPAERVDMVVDFSKSAAHCSDIVLTNSAVAPYPGGDPCTGGQCVVMRFRVGSKKMPAVKLPKTLVNVPKARPDLAVRERYITLDETDDDANGAPLYDLLGGKHWTDPATEVPALGTAELWHFVNLTPDMHPIHIHMVSHRVIERRAFDVDGYTAGTCVLVKPAGKSKKRLPSCYQGVGQKPPKNEQGWKDTTKMAPEQVTTLLLSFTTREGKPFPFNALAGPGYVTHCHILDHEDNDMMRPYKILPAGAGH